VIGRHPPDRAPQVVQRFSPRLNHDLAAVLVPVLCLVESKSSRWQWVARVKSALTKVKSEYYGMNRNRLSGHD
jgi:hypothetical protein